MKAEFTVTGNPVGKGRPRFARRGNAVKTYTPEKTASYETLVGWEYRRQCGEIRFPEDVGIKISIDAYYAIPKSVSEKKKQRMRSGEIRPTKKPDSDNVIKAVCDGLNGIAFHDDAQIVECRFSKKYSDQPRTEIMLETAEEREA